MDWLNIHASTLDSPQFIGSDPVERSTWLCLLRFCIGQENGGVIEDCADWQDRRWQQLARVTKREIARKCELWSFDGEKLIVWAYPVSKQEEVQAKRKAGLDTAAKRWKKHDSSVDSSATRSADTEGKEKEKEGEGNGKENKDTLTLVSLPDAAPEKTELQLRAEKLMNRKATTPYNDKDKRAWKNALPSIQATSEEDWQYLEEFYRLPQCETFARKSYDALLNNWTGEIDRARSFRRKGSTRDILAAKRINDQYQEGM